MSIIEKNNEPSDEFLTICPRSKKYLQYNVDAIPLKVALGVNVTPDINIKVNRLQEGKQIVNHSYHNHRFKISIVINKEDTIYGSYYNETVVPDLNMDTVINMTGLELDDLLSDEGFNPAGYSVIDEGAIDIPVITALDYWIINCEPLYVVTDAIDIKDDYYVIIANSGRKQELHNNVIWELEFIQYEEFMSSNFQNNNSGVQKAIKKYNQKKKTSTPAGKKQQQINQTTKLKNKFKKCDYKKIKYSKTKKTSDCVKIMQQLLIHYKCLKDSKNNKDGWFGKTTKEAVKAFQKKYKYRHNLKETGTVNYKTWKALYTGGSANQIGNTKVIK